MKGSSAEYYRLWRASNRDKCAAYTRKYHDSKPELYLLNLARGRARQLGVKFDLEIGDIKIPDICPVFLVPFERRTGYAPSVDRKDPTKGYTKDNVQVISKRANTMKSNASVSELHMFANWIKLNV